MSLMFDETSVKVYEKYYEDSYKLPMYFSSSTFIGEFVEKAVALYLDYPWRGVFDDVYAPYFIHAREFETDDEVINAEFDIIATAMGYIKFPPELFDLRDNLKVLVARVCKMLEPELPMLYYSRGSQVHNIGHDRFLGDFGYIKDEGEIDFIMAGEKSEAGRSIWELKTGARNSATAQIWRNWVCGVVAGIFGPYDVNRIGILLPKENLVRYWQIDEISVRKRVEIIAAYGYKEQANRLFYGGY